MRREGLIQAKKERAKPYEQMERPEGRVQIAVKAVPHGCITDPGLKLYQYTAIDGYTRYRVTGAYSEQRAIPQRSFAEGGCVQVQEG